MDPSPVVEPVAELDGRTPEPHGGARHYLGGREDHSASRVGSDCSSAACLTPATLCRGAEVRLQLDPHRLRAPLSAATGASDTRSLAPTRCSDDITAERPPRPTAMPLRFTEDAEQHSANGCDGHADDSGAIFGSKDDTHTAAHPLHSPSAPLGCLAAVGRAAGCSPQDAARASLVAAEGRPTVLFSEDALASLMIGAPLMRSPPCAPYGCVTALAVPPLVTSTSLFAITAPSWGSATGTEAAESRRGRSADTNEEALSAPPPAPTTPPGRACGSATTVVPRGGALLGASAREQDEEEEEEVARPWAPLQGHATSGSAGTAAAAACGGSCPSSPLLLSSTSSLFARLCGADLPSCSLGRIDTFTSTDVELDSRERGALVSSLTELEAAPRKSYQHEDRGDSPLSAPSSAYTPHGGLLDAVDGESKGTASAAAGMLAMAAAAATAPHSCRASSLAHYSRRRLPSASDDGSEDLDNLFRVEDHGPSASAGAARGDGSSCFGTADARPNGAAAGFSPVSTLVSAATHRVDRSGGAVNSSLSSWGTLVGPLTHEDARRGGAAADLVAQMALLSLDAAPGGGEADHAGQTQKRLAFEDALDDESSACTGGAHSGAMPGPSNGFGGGSMAGQMTNGEMPEAYGGTRTAPTSPIRARDASGRLTAAADGAYLCERSAVSRFATPPPPPPRSRRLPSAALVAARQRQRQQQQQQQQQLRYDRQVSEAPLLSGSDARARPTGLQLLQSRKRCLAEREADALLTSAPLLSSPSPSSSSFTGPFEPPSTRSAASLATTEWPLEKRYRQDCLGTWESSLPWAASQHRAASQPTIERAPATASFAPQRSLVLSELQPNAVAGTVTSWCPGGRVPVSTSAVSALGPAAA